jgi:hypothetical protein
MYHELFQIKKCPTLVVRVEAQEQANKSHVSYDNENLYQKTLIFLFDSRIVALRGKAVLVWK